MAKKKNITIFFPCVGRRVVLLNSFRKTARQLGLTCRIVGADSDEFSPALQCCDRKFVAKRVSDPGYTREMLSIIKREKVDLLIPTVDLDLAIWARHRTKLARTGCTALISTPKVVQICQDKRLTYEFLKKHGFDTPKTISARQALTQARPQFPCFLKPWDGHASRGNYIALNRDELRFYSKHVPNCIVQEFINGQEYTVDVLVDFDGHVRCIVPRRRIEVRSGEVSKAVSVKHPEIMNLCQKLIQILKAGPGIITIQCFLTPNNQVKIIEINPRFGGGVPLSIKAGANFPKWILQLWLGQNPQINPTRFREGLMMLRYDEAVWFQK